MNSLSATIDSVNRALFLDRNPQTAWAKSIAGRQGLPGSYAGMFAPTELDFRNGVTVFTGEQLRSRAGTAHILGEEACRVLRLLDLPATRPALARATANMIARLDEAERRGYGVGTYCCGPCTCAYWRHLAAGGLNRQGERLALGIKALRSRRLDKGRWRTFPFWFTLLALTDLSSPAARAEKQFAAPVCERHLKRPPAGKFGARRRHVAELILAQAQ